MRNAFVLAAIGALAILAVAPIRAAQPVAEYNFQNTLASSVAGAPDLAPLVDPTTQVNNTFITTVVDGATRTVVHFPQFNGVALSPTTGLIASDVYSIVMLFSFEDVSGYRRVLDFKHGTTDNGLYTLNGNLNFYPVATGSGTPITANSYHQVTLTRDAAGTVNGFVDGAPAFSFADAGGSNAVVDEANLLRFFQDNTGGNAPVRESSAGNVARIRVYNVALTDTEVAGLDRLPGVVPSGIRLLRIVGGLEPATSGDVTKWDSNGDNAITIADVVAYLRG